MRIAYITADPGVPIFGRKGCSIHVREVLRALIKCGSQIELFAANCSGTPPPDLEDLSVHPLPASPKGDLAFRERQCLAANEPLREMLERKGSFDLIYERYSLWSYAGMEHAKTSGIPGLLEVNAPLIEEQAEHRGLIDRSGALEVARRAFNSATALVAVSDEVAAYLNSFNAAHNKVSVIPNGVNPERFQAALRNASSSDPGRFTVGFVGSMKPWHGVGNLVGAFALLHSRFPESRLLLVGDGPGREQLAAEVASRNLTEAVHFTGAVASEDVPALLSSMDVAVAPYPRLANFYFSPLKVYEYMAAGLPVVASRVGQIEQLIETEITGLLVSPGDVDALASGLERLYLDPDLRRHLGQAAREKVVRHHTWDAAVQHILRLAGIPSTEHIVKA